MANGKSHIHCVVQAQDLLAFAPGRTLSQSPVGYLSIRKCNLLGSIYSFEHY